MILAALVLAGCAGSSHSERDVQGGDDASRYVYVTNEGSDSVAMYEANVKTHNLTYFGVIPAGHGPRGMASGRNTGNSLSYEGRLVVANTGDNTLSVYRIFNTGSLELLHTVPTGSRPVEVSIPLPDNETGPINVLCEGSHEVIQYQWTTDSIEEVSRAATGNDPTTLASGYASSTGSVLGGGVLVAVADGTSNQLLTYSESTAGLTPTTPSTFATGRRPTSLAAFPQFFYDPHATSHPDMGAAVVLNEGDETVSVYDLASLTLKKTSTLDPGSHGMAFDQYFYGDFIAPTKLFTANDSLHTITGYSINLLTGAITKGDGSTATTGSGRTNALTSISNLYGLLLATNSSGGLRAYKEPPASGTSTSLSLNQTLDTQGSNPYGIGLTNVDVIPTGGDALAITLKGTPADGKVGTAYDSAFQILATHDGPKPTVALASGTLPPGLSIGPSSVSTISVGTHPAYFDILGTPTTSGTYTFALKITLNGHSITSPTYTVVIGDSTVSGTVGRFFNLDPQAGHDPLVLKINGTTFPAVGFGTGSAALAVTASNAAPYEIDDASGNIIEQSSTFLSSSGTRFFFVKNILGFTAGTFPAAYPASGSAGVTFVGGAGSSGGSGQQDVDVYPQGSSVSVAHDTFTLAGTLYLQVPPGTYVVQVSNGTTHNPIVTSSAFTVAAGKTALACTTSDDRLGTNTRIFAFLY